MNKIVYVLNYTGDGGTEKYVLDLISAIGRKKCVLLYSKPGPSHKKFIELGIPMYQVTMRHPFDLIAAIQIKKIVEEEKAKIIHTQFLRENYISLLASFLGADVRVIWTYHVNVPMPTYVKLLNRIMTRFNYKIISVAEYMKKELSKKGVPLNKITVIHNGIRIPSKVNTKVMKHDEKIISVIGRLSEEKGHKFLLFSLAKLRKNYPELKWKLNVVGDGPLRQELMVLTEKLGLNLNVDFRGYVENIDSIYSNSDVIVIPSENEALPFVAIEALAFKKPVVSTNVGGIPEIIHHNKTGLLVNYGDTDTLSQNIYRILSNEELSKELSKNGQEFFFRT